MGSEQGMSSPVDAGAREIHRLLTAPNPALTHAMKAHSTSLSHSLAVTKTGKPRLQVPASSIEAVNKLRSAYRDLRARIAATETQQQVSKRRVLAALDQLDSSLEVFTRSLTAQNAATGAELARQAYWKRERAAVQLERAAKELR